MPREHRLTYHAVRSIFRVLVQPKLEYGRSRATEILRGLR